MVSWFSQLLAGQLIEQLNLCSHVTACLSSRTTLTLDKNHFVDVKVEITMYFFCKILVSEIFDRVALMY